ncbi:MAG: hypothetical protein WCQ90_14045 [Deltaproteobacteria bacterium]
MPNLKKLHVKECIVLNCSNRSDQGTFVGDLCAPCYEFITTRKGKNSQAYRNAVEVGKNEILSLIINERSK